MSSVAACACFHAVFMAYCFASSREKTMILLGAPISRRSSRRTSDWPREPVPPVTSTTAPSSGCFIALPRCQVVVEHLVPGRRLDAGRGAEAARVERPVQGGLVHRADGAIQVESVAHHGQELELVDRFGGDMVDAGQRRVRLRDLDENVRESARGQAGEDRLAVTGHLLAFLAGKPGEEAGSPVQLPADDRSAHRQGRLLYLAEQLGKAVEVTRVRLVLLAIALAQG